LDKNFPKHKKSRSKIGKNSPTKNALCPLLPKFQIDPNYNLKERLPPQTTWLEAKIQSGLVMMHLKLESTK
jgi:hypothetical protein